MGDDASGTRGVLNGALSIYFEDATLAGAFVTRWCVRAKVEAAGGVFQVREDEPEPRWGRGCTEHLRRRECGPAASSAFNPTLTDLPVAEDAQRDDLGLATSEQIREMVGLKVRKAAGSVRERATGFWRDGRGVVAVSVAILLPILIGFAGIGVEIGLWFAIQRQNQSAADAAAISAGLEYAAQIESGVATNPTAAATTAAGYNLFSTNPPNTLTLYPCYGFTVGTSCNTSSSNGALNAVQVALIQPLNTTFANIVTAIWGRTSIPSMSQQPRSPHSRCCEAAKPACWRSAAAVLRPAILSWHQATQRSICPIVFWRASRPRAIRCSYRGQAI